MLVGAPFDPSLPMLIRLTSRRKSLFNPVLRVGLQILNPRSRGSLPIATLSPTLCLARFVVSASLSSARRLRQRWQSARKKFSSSVVGEHAARLAHRWKKMS